MDDHVGHHAHDLMAPPETFVQGKCDEAAEVALRHRGKREQRLRGHDARPGLLLHPEGPHLGTVAVHHRDLPTAIDKLADRSRHGARVLALLRVGARLVGVAQRVASQGDEGTTTHAVTSLAGLAER
jgi:hypothetical protein